MTANICPIWNSKATVIDHSDNPYLDVTSPRAGGRYHIRRDAIKMLAAQQPATKAKLTTMLINDYNAGGYDTYIPEIERRLLEVCVNRPALSVQD